MTLRAELWTRPGDASFGRLVADLPVIDGSLSKRRNGIGDGTITLPDNYPRLSEILDAPDGASYGGASSIIRIYDQSTLVTELIPNQLIPTTEHGDHIVEIGGVDIGSILSYGRLEPFDWDGSNDHTSLFPDWKFGAENLITDGTFENIGTAATFALFVADESYSLSFTATGGTFTLTVGANTTVAIAYNATAGTIETELENLASVTDVEVSTDDAGVHLILFKNPENVSPDMTINTGGLTGGTASLTKLFDGFTKSGTTFTLTVDAQTTSNLDWDTNNLAIENALQALSTVAEVTVSDAAGTQDDPWIIVFYDPANPGSFTVDDTGLSGGTADLTTVQAGADSFGSWETSRYADKRVSVDEHGAVSTFQLVADTIGGIGAVTALEFKASLQFGGAQTIVKVTPGATTQMSVWVKSSSATARYRWVIRAVTDELDNCITGHPSCSGEFTLAANTWTQLTLTDVQIPSSVSEIIFRVAYVGTVEPQAGTMRIWGATVQEGLPAGTIGYMTRIMYEDMIDPHGSADPIYWDNGAGTQTPYLTLDYSDTVDSAGQTWAADDLAHNFLKGQSFLRCVTEAAALGSTTGGYVWRVVPNSAAAGTYYLQIFNPGGDASWDLSADDDCPTVRGGKDTVSRSARSFLPDATDLAVEGAGFQIARRRNTAAVAALGKIGGYVGNRDLPDLTAVTSYAQADLALRLATSKSLTYRVIPDATNWRPLVDYQPGFTILVEDEPLISKSAHLVDAVRAAWGSTPVEYEVHFDSESFVGSEAVNEGVRRLLAQFQGIRPDPLGAVAARGGAGLNFYLVAASDSEDIWKENAQTVCAGADDDKIIDQLWQNGIYRVLFAPGTFYLNQANGGYIGGGDSTYIGCGAELTRFRCYGAVTSTYQPAVDVRVIESIQFLDFTGTSAANNFTGVLVSSYEGSVRNCEIATTGVAVIVDANFCRIENSYLFGTTDAVFIQGNSISTVIDGNLIAANDSAVYLGSAQYPRITNNYIAGTGSSDYGVYLDSSVSASHVYISGNTFEQHAINGIHLDLTLVGPEQGPFTITDNGFVFSSAAVGAASTAAGIYILSGTDTPPITIAGNSFYRWQNAGAIQLEDCNGVTVSRNRIYSTGRHGIHLIDSSECTIEGNHIGGSKTSLNHLAADDTYDGVILAGNSDRNFIHGNKIFGTGATNQHRYAINISAATCDDNVVVNNDLRPSANFVSGQYNDAGTGTINTYPAGAAGDNFV